MSGLSNACSMFGYRSWPGLVACATRRCSGQRPSPFCSSIKHQEHQFQLHISSWLDTSGVTPPRVTASNVPAVSSWLRSYIITARYSSLLKVCFSCIHCVIDRVRHCRTSAAQSSDVDALGPKTEQNEFSFLLLCH